MKTRTLRSALAAALVFSASAARRATRAALPPDPDLGKNRERKLHTEDWP